MPTKRPKPKLPTQTEAAFQKQVIDLAHLYGWKVVTFRPARTKRGWRTPVGADGMGWVDLVLVRERVIYVELKTDTGRFSREQVAWGIRLKKAGQEYHLWRPADWPEIERTLR